MMSRRMRDAALTIALAIPVLSCAKATPDSSAAANVFALGAVDAMPERQSGPALLYPALPKEAGIEGRVEVEFVVQPGGAVDTASLTIVTTANQQFVSAARAAILGSHYKPGEVGGKPVAVRLRQLVRFLLTQPGSPSPPQAQAAAFTVIADVAK